MTRFIRKSLDISSGAFCNYANRPPAPCDLSLISGPFIWKDEVEQACRGADISLFSAYPLPNQNPALIEILADHDGLSPASIWLTPGADMAIEAILGHYLEPGSKFGIMTPNFPRFRIVAATIPDVEVATFDTIHNCPADMDLVAICTPNNPSTREIPQDDLRRLIGAHPETLFCIDAVFDWYSSYYLGNLVRDFDNVLVLKSFSKIGLAGLRLGYVAANPDLVSELQIGASPFAVPALVQSIGLEVARSFDRIPEISTILGEQYQVIAAALGDSVVRASPVPFYLMHLNRTSREAAELLFEEGISVVDEDHCPDIPEGCLRVAIGSTLENRRILDAVDRLGLAR